MGAGASLRVGRGKSIFAARRAPLEVLRQATDHGAPVIRPEESEW